MRASAYLVLLLLCLTACGATSTPMTGPPNGPTGVRPRLQVVRRTWRLPGTRATPVRTARTTLHADPATYAASHCPGLDPSGEPTR
jgi:hypothetical protein